MIDSSKKLSFKRSAPSRLLGLSLDGTRVEAVVLQRVNGSLTAGPPSTFALTLDPLTADPQLVGRELRNHLDAAGIRERVCAVALPLNWALTAAVEIPALPEGDIPGFLLLEAERGFHCDAATLRVEPSRFQTPGGQKHALLVGIPQTQLQTLAQIIRAARLKPVSFGLGLAALQPPPPPEHEGALALRIGETRLGLQIACGGGIAALRVVESALAAEGPKRNVDSDLVTREIRITLGQIPPDLRETIRRVRIFGPRDLAQQLADDLELRLDSLSLKIEPVTHYEANEFGLSIASEVPITTACSLAARRLANQGTFEFLPPQISAWRQLTNRYASGRLRTAGIAAAGIAALVLGALLIQQIQLWRLQAQWSEIASKTKELEQIEEQVRRYRAWYDDSLRVMSILRQLTLAFPEEGSVWARTIEIRDAGAVACTGLARDHQSLLKTHEQLRAANGVAELKISQIRGKTPEQFTFDFVWRGGRP